MRRACRGLWFALALQAVALGAEGSLDATIPVEVLAPDPALGSGRIAIGSNMWGIPVVLAMQPVRIARGIVVERRLGRSEVLALTLIGVPRKTPAGALDLDPPREMLAWCEMASTTFAITMEQYRVDCYQDRDGDGALETEYIGHLSGPVGILVSSIDTPQPRSPYQYRPAKVEELPLFHVGYMSCGRAAEKSAADIADIRYGTYIRSAAGGKPGGSSCKDIGELVEQRGDERVYRVGRFMLGVRENSGTLETRLIEGIPAGTILANLGFSRPLLDATQSMPQVGAGEKPTLYLVTIPQTVAAVKSGDIFFTAQVAHGITGRLRSYVKVRGWGARIEFAAGTPMFGVPMGGSSGMGNYKRETEPAMTWCAPSRDEQKALVTQCFTGPDTNAVIRSPAPFMVESLYGTPRYSETPLIDRGPVEFEAPLFLMLRFVRAKKEFLELESSVSYEREPKWITFRPVRREDGSATVLVGGAVLRVMPGADDSSASVEVLAGEFKPGSYAIPQDVRLRVKSPAAG